jgi:hypothetical protein
MPMRALAEALRMAEERRRAAARSARDLAVLARGTDVGKAGAYYLIPPTQRHGMTWRAPGSTSVKPLCGLPLRRACAATSVNVSPV